MSTTTTALTATTLVGILPTMTTTAADKTCPNCGQEGILSLDQSTEEAQQRIRDLEGQVEDLNTQATQTAEKLAWYEDEVRRLRVPTTPKNGSSISSSSSARSNDLDKSLSPTQLPSSGSPQSQQSQPQSRLSTFTSFLPYRRTSATPPTSAPAAVQSSSPPNSVHHSIHEDTLELQNALNREQNLRKAAENQLSQASTELEDLTAQLFSQANEMVAEERRARAKLEERVAILERRDVEKRKRLDRLEKAMARVERVRALVG